MPSRLNKRLVELGLASSRRKADELIVGGAVQVDGMIVTNLATQITSDQTVTLYGRGGHERTHIYLAFNKPVGFVCTHRSQTSKQKTIFDFLPLSFAGLKIAGRLDKDSQGLMILSSDGEFIQAITHPSHGKLKTYLVTVDKPVTQAHRDQLVKGVMLKDGKSTFSTVASIKPTLLRISLGEGRNRQVRRTFEQLGYRVKVLERTRVGKFDLGQLKPGEHRFIKPGDAL